MTTFTNAGRRRRAALMSGMAVLSTLTTTLAAPTPALAWKPKTHIYLAEEALRDALDNGKVTIYETAYANGEIVGVLGEFDVDPEILKALRSSPKQFRAGVVGPDAYPDIATGQQIIHPDAARVLEDSQHAANGAAGGSNSWLQHLWEKGFIGTSDTNIRAFTLGYMTHAAGDVFAHTFVNHFTGGEFQILPDPTNGAKHIILEGYVGKRTPVAKAATPRMVSSGTVCNPRKRDDLGQAGEECGTTVKALYPPVDFTDMSISGVETFIHDQMVRATPGSRLETMLLQGEGTGRSVPAIFSSLRNGLAEDVKDAASYNPVAAFKRAWIKDIDDGLRAWPAVSEKVAAKLVFTDPGPADVAGAKAIMDQYVRDHLASMLGAPDVAVAFVGLISDAINVFVPPPAREFLGELTKQPVNWLIKGVSGRTPEQWEQYVSHPETNFDKALNARGGAHGGAVDHPVNLKTFNREHLKIDDDAYAHPELRWKIEDVPAAFDTLQLTKMMMLGEAGLGQLKSALQVKGVDMPPLPARNSNIMLGWVRSLDAGNQWQGLQTSRSGVSPQPAFAVNAAVYQKLFLPVIGEARWEATDTHGSSPAPATPPAPITGADLAGAWTSPLGSIDMRTIPEGAYGEITVPIIGVSQTITLTPQPARSYFSASWRMLNGSASAQYNAELSGDRMTLHFEQTGSKSPIKVAAKFDAKRIGEPPPPSPFEPEPRPPVIEYDGPSGPPPPGEGSDARPPASPGPSSPWGGGTPVPGLPLPGPSLGGFQESGALMVKLDAARMDRIGQADFLLTLRNPTKDVIRVTDSTFHVVLTDADGLGSEVTQLHRAGEGPPVRFDSAPDVQPGGELKVRYIVKPFEGAAPIRALHVHPGYTGAPATFDVAQLVNPMASDHTPPASGSGKFVSLEDWDIRLDKLMRLPNGITEVFFTARNATGSLQQTGGSEIEFSWTAPDGATYKNARQLTPARGPRPRPLHDSALVQPGEEARLRTFFHGPVDGPLNVTDWKLKGVLN